MAIRIQPYNPDHSPAGLPRRQVINAIFCDPVSGSDIPVLVTLFQLASGTEGYGVGFYTLSETGEPERGTVLRWDAGPDSNPAVIQWQAPHCAEDTCEHPCAH